jgi:thioredoxin reductase
MVIIETTDPIILSCRLFLFEYAVEQRVGYMEIFDCVIVGAGPAGLNASLVLGRARRNVALIDNGTNRNRVTQFSHGFVTRDGIKPEEFRDIALEELKNYPSVQFFQETVTQIQKRSDQTLFQVRTQDEKLYIAEKIILAAGVTEVHPSVPDLKSFYGKSIFSCPYCDGWELRDQPLIVVAEQEKGVHHMAKLVYNWSRDLVVATNGNQISAHLKNELEYRNIVVVTEPIKKLHGEDGYLHAVEFASELKMKRIGGFIVPEFHRPNSFAEQLGCEFKEKGVMVMDGLGRTTQKNVYSAGEFSQVSPSALILAAADGSNAAFAVNADITNERF